MTATSPLRVLRVAPYFFLPGRHIGDVDLQYEPIGGMQVQIAQLSEDVDRLGAHQRVLLPRRPGVAARQPLGRGGVLEFLRVPVAPIRTRNKGYLGLLVSWGSAVVAWAARERLRGRAGRWSVVHVHCSELPWTYVVALAVRKLLGRPMVLTIHCSAIVTFHPDTWGGRLLGWLAMRAERRALRRADAVVVLTARVKRRYTERRLVDPERVHVVPDGVRSELFRAAASTAATATAATATASTAATATAATATASTAATATAAAPTGTAATGTAGDTPVVLYAGRLAPEKGWRDFVAAADLVLREHKLPARFHLYGDGNERRAVAEEIAARGLGDHVTLRGHVERHEIAAALGEADVVVVPSIHEELGGTVLESMTAGKALVCTNVGGLGEVIDHRRNGLLANPGRPDELAGHVAELLRSPELRAKLGAAAAADVAGFEAEVVAGQMVDLYRLLAAGPAAELS